MSGHVMWLYILPHVMLPVNNMVGILYLASALISVTYGRAIKGHDIPGIRPLVKSPGEGA